MARARKSWLRRHLEQYEKTMAKLTKALDDDLRAHGGRGTGDTTEVSYFQLREVLEFHDSFIEDMRVVTRIQEAAAGLSEAAFFS